MSQHQVLLVTELSEDPLCVRMIGIDFVQKRVERRGVDEDRYER